MTSINDAMLQEFREESALTKRLLDRIPADKLSWKPHPKSMSIGQLAIHIAGIPGAFARITQPDAFDLSRGNFVPPQPKNLEEIQAAFSESVRAGEQCLAQLTEEKAQGNWRLMLKDKEIFTKPRVNVLRSLMMNHWYHHRGQLSVYLRLLEVPVPEIYGRSADESPFT